ncbi:MAG: MMPL family transporter [Kosmotoga sp.]|nr:MAG: MMPL family transporter [Kosmotoga sp.]
MVKVRFIVVIITIFLSLMAIVDISDDIKIDTNPQVFIPENEYVKSYRNFVEKTGSLNTGMFLIKLDENNDNIIKGLEYLRSSLSEFIGNGIDRVFSPLDAVQLKITSILPLRFETTNIIDNPDDINRLVDDPLYNNFLVSKDKEYLNTFFWMSELGNNDSLMAALEKMERKLKDEYGLEAMAFGEFLVQKTLFDYIKQLTFLYPPLIILIIIILFGIALKDFWLGFIAIIPSMVAVVFSYWLMIRFSITINTLTTLVGSLIVIIGSVYGLHIAKRLLINREKAVSEVELFKITLREEIVPIMFSSLTTVAGFMSFIFAPMRAFKMFGLFISVGLMITALYACFLLPFFVSMKGKNHRKPIKLEFLVIPGKEILNILKYVCAIIIICGFISIPFVRVSTDELSYFSSNSEIVSSANKISESFGYLFPYYVVIEKPEQSEFSSDKEFFNVINSELKKIDHINGTKSLIDVSKSTGFGLSVLNSPLLRDTSLGSFLSSFVTENKYIIMINSTVTDTKIAGQIETDVNELLNSYNLTGNVYSPVLIWRRINNEVVINQTVSMLGALAVIFLLTSILLKSITDATISIIGVISAIMSAFIAMAIFSIPLEIGTSIVSVMLAGIVIDYAIHLKIWQRRDQKGYPEVVKTVLANSYALALGFSVLLFSPLKLYARVAVIVIIGVLVGGYISIAVLSGEKFAKILNRFKLIKRRKKNE